MGSLPLSAPWCVSSTVLLLPAVIAFTIDVDSGDFNSDTKAKTSIICIELSLYCFDLGTYAYQNRAFGCHPGVWSKINFSHKVRYRIKAEVISFLLHYWAGVDSTSPPRSNGGKLSNWRDLLDFG